MPAPTRFERIGGERAVAALVGPIRYTGRTMSEVHAGRGIQVRHVARFVDHLEATLADPPISEPDAYDIASRINTYVDEITGRANVDG